VKIDESSIAIIKHLRDGRRSFKEIADDLGLSENTVRSRVNKLKEKGVMEITGLMDPSSIPGHRVVITGLKLKNTDVLTVGERLSKVKGVVSTCIVTGSYDIMLVVLLNGEYDLLQYYTGQLAKFDEIQSAETFVVFKGFNLKVPYVL